MKLGYIQYAVMRPTEILEALLLGARAKCSQNAGIGIIGLWHLFTVKTIGYQSMAQKTDEF